MTSFADRLIAWQKRHGRHDLPWQRTRDPYRIWLAEVMLQQTPVATVIPYYQRFLERFPNVAALAAASLEEALAAWSGLGYYARARLLHRCAQEIVTAHRGEFPREARLLARLPGIGRSTANAIAVFAYGARAPILDGNVKRVLCRHAGIEGWPGAAAVSRLLWRHAEQLLPESEVTTYIQGQMDLGALVCTPRRPRCADCPVAADCIARRTGRAESLPTPRPRRNLPVRAATFLILRHGDRFLLEARPPLGLWGGMWSLPELPKDAEVTAYCQEKLALEVIEVSRGPSWTHLFSHFRLVAHCWLATVRPIAFAEPRLVPVCRQELAAAPLPAPVRRLLSAIP